MLLLVALTAGFVGGKLYYVWLARDEVDLSSLNVDFGLARHILRKARAIVGRFGCHRSGGGCDCGPRLSVYWVP
jgi:hypothetical protein